MSKEIVLVGRERFSSPQVNERQLVLRNQKITVDDKVADHLLSQERLDRKGNKIAIWVEADSPQGKAALSRNTNGSARRGSGDISVSELRKSGGSKDAGASTETADDIEPKPENKPKRKRKSRAKKKAVEETDNA